jgi:putative membrane protein
MRFGLILLVLLFAVAGAVFGALNSQTVELDFYFGIIVLGKGAALLSALLIGWLLGGLLVYLSLVVPLRRRVRRQARLLRNPEAPVKAVGAVADATATPEHPQ